MDSLSRKKKIALMITFIILWICLQITVMFFGGNSRLQSFSGVITASQFAVCLLIVWVNYKVGTFISLGFMVFSIISMIMAISRAGNLGALPGLCNVVIYIITMLLLCRQFRIREKEAITDFLTGLINRRGLYKELKRNIEKKKPFYVIYLDLENFKMINDNYGNVYGDGLLKLVTERMHSVMGGKGIVSRLGGAEFVVIVDGDSDVADITEKLIARICEKISLPANFIWIDSYLKVSAGISRFPEDSDEAEELIKYADIAMLQAIKDKKTNISFFDKDMESHLKREVELEKLIKEALAKNYFYLVYQPQYKLDGKRLRGFESLLRMKTAKGEFVSPAEFIPVAEKGDLILQIDDYVLRRVMKEFKEIVEKAEDDILISVNVSAKNISSKGFADKVKAIMDETSFPAKNLEIEITEYCMVRSVEITIENIIALRALGAQVALDDFGTGYTSLSYLAKMPINLLKVDKSLVDDIVADEKSKDFVTAVIAMGHLMGCEVISEGVENEDQLDVLNEQECDFVQGYVWGKPVDYGVARSLALGKEA